MRAGVAKRTLLVVVAIGGFALGAISQSSHVCAMDLKQVLAAAYFNSPELDAARARLRATDETVSQAHGIFRPRVNASAANSAIHSNTSGTGAAVIGGGEGGAGTITSGGDLTTIARSLSVTVEQSLFRGLRSINRLREAEAGVRAGQA